MFTTKKITYNVAGEKDSQGGVVLRSTGLEAQVCSKPIDCVICKFDSIDSSSVRCNNILAALAMFVLVQVSELVIGQK